MVVVLSRWVLWWFVIQQKWLKQEENREAPFSQASVMETKDFLLKSCLSRNFISGDTIPQVPPLIPVLRIRDAIGSCVCVARECLWGRTVLFYCPPLPSPHHKQISGSYQSFQNTKKMYRGLFYSQGEPTSLASPSILRLHTCALRSLSSDWLLITALGLAGQQLFQHLSHKKSEFELATSFFLSWADILS